LAAKAGLYQVDPAEPILTDKFGGRLTPKAATNAFSRLATSANLSTTSLHAARHTAATNLIAGGVDLRTAAGLLGHTTPNVTLALYSHIVEGAERSAVDILCDRLSRAAEKQPESA
jgi:site-specific recombinase XerD